MTVTPHDIDPRLDLVLERFIDVPTHLVWRAWTEPELLVKWFTPAPWTTPECEIDLRPGGAFRTVMRSPEGEEGGGVACYLEIVEGEKLVWTGALAPGFRPKALPEGELVFTAVITMEAAAGGTRYRALVMHRDEAGRREHEEMGFHQGWGTALDQLVALAKASQENRA